MILSEKRISDSMKEFYKTESNVIFIIILKFDVESFHLQNNLGKSGPTMSNTSKRGSLIVFEGCDRSGITTQVAKLVGKLTEQGKQPMSITFPDKTSDIGSIITSYFTHTKELDNHAMHLLFSANIWEKKKEILNTLKEGTDVIIDRYAYGGAAFSAAKEGLTLDWCMKTDIGLPKPDLVCFMDVTKEVTMNREDFGGERWEIPHFQRKVRENFLHLSDSSWVHVPADGSLEEVEEELYDVVMREVDKTEKGELGKLWAEYSVINFKRQSDKDE